MIEQVHFVRLDVVFAKGSLGTSRGRLVWREPLVWAAAETLELVAGAVLPLASYCERSVSRERLLVDVFELNENIDRAFERRGETVPFAITPVPQTWVKKSFGDG
jgi:hypothetical protein